MTETETHTTDLAEALRADAGRLRSVLAAALDCIVAMDASGRVVEWNLAAERTFGWSHDEALGQEMADLIVPAPLRESHRGGLARYLEGGQPLHGDPAVRGGGAGGAGCAGRRGGA